MAKKSSLPEKFETFEENMKAKEPAKENTKPVGGMTEGEWSGQKMWSCPRCNATTFNEVQAKTHTCKTIRLADEEDGE